MERDGRSKDEAAEVAKTMLAKEANSDGHVATTIVIPMVIRIMPVARVCCRRFCGDLIRIGFMHLPDEPGFIPDRRQDKEG